MIKNSLVIRFSKKDFKYIHIDHLKLIKMYLIITIRDIIHDILLNRKDGYDIMKNIFIKSDSSVINIFNMDHGYINEYLRKFEREYHEEFIRMYLDDEKMLAFKNMVDEIILSKNKKPSIVIDITVIMSNNNIYARIRNNE